MYRVKNTGLKHINQDSDSDSDSNSDSRVRLKHFVAVIRYTKYAYMYFQLQLLIFSKPLVVLALLAYEWFLYFANFMDTINL